MERLTERHHKKEDAGLAHGWISVEERLPAVREDVLVYYESGRISIDWFRRITDAFSFEELYGRVTHWMPLPKPPEWELGEAKR